MQSLHLRTMQLLRLTEIPLPDIAKDIEVSYFWLRSFKSGAIQDPSVNRVQKLYEYLTETTLELI